MTCDYCDGTGEVCEYSGEHSRYIECANCEGTGTVDDPEPCPMGCGRTTEDVYGGPCKACWARV